MILFPAQSGKCSNFAASNLVPLAIKNNNNNDNNNIIMMMNVRNVYRGKSKTENLKRGKKESNSNKRKTTQKLTKMSAAPINL